MAVTAPFFFYGVLMDRDVLRLVTRRPVPAAACRAAAIDGFSRVYRDGASYPILIPADGACVEGILVSGLGDAEEGRLRAFEGDEYDLVTVPVRKGRGGAVEARVFMPRSGVPASSLPWMPEHWRRHHRARYLARLRAERSSPRHR